MHIQNEKNLIFFDFFAAASGSLRTHPSLSDHLQNASESEVLGARGQRLQSGRETAGDLSPDQVVARAMAFKVVGLCGR